MPQTARQTDRHALAANLAPTLTLGRVPASDGWRWSPRSGQAYPLEQRGSHKTGLVRNLLRQPFCCSPLGAPRVPFGGAQLSPQCCFPCGGLADSEGCEVDVQPRGSARGSRLAAVRAARSRARGTPNADNSSSRPQKRHH